MRPCNASGIDDGPTATSTGLVLLLVPSSRSLGVSVVDADDDKVEQGSVTQKIEKDCQNFFFFFFNICFLYITISLFGCKENQCRKGTKL